jgi:hypothetical protein
VIQFFYSVGSRTVKAFKEAVSSDLLPHITMTVAHKDTRPKRGQLILVAGEGSASKAVERFAWRLGGYPIYVPECSDWLTHRIREAVENGTDLVMVDSSLASTEQLSGSK